MNDKQDTDTTPPETNPESTQTPVTGWQFVADDPNSKKAGTTATPNPEQSTNPSNTVSWTEVEFVAHKKSLVWYIGLGLAAAVVATLVYIYNHDLVSVIVIVIAAVFLGFVANRQPRDLDYQVDDTGIKIGEKFYTYNNFRSFFVGDEGSISSVVLQPLKRFMPFITIYYPSDKEKAILEVLNKHLPVDNSHHDAIDSLLRRIHY